MSRHFDDNYCEKKQILYTVITEWGEQGGSWRNQIGGTLDQWNSVDNT